MTGKKRKSETRNKTLIYWLIGSVVTFFLLAISVALIWYFSRAEGTESQSLSRGMAGSIQDWIASMIEIDPTDYFWDENLNSILRKLAHLLEYMLLGFAASLFFFSLFKRIWAGSLLALVAGVICASADEYQQSLTDGRAGLISDIGIDMIGVSAGVLFAAFVVALVRHIWRQEKRIAHLEQQMEPYIAQEQKQQMEPYIAQEQKQQMEPYIAQEQKQQMEDNSSTSENH